jgi:23S rRNA (cytosine1962-C5)-methyltransferase
MIRSVILKKGKESALARKHPWIFSGAIHQTDKGLKEGGLTDVFDAMGGWMCRGHWHGASIAVRVLTWQQNEHPDTQAFWESRFRTAWSLRAELGVINKKTNCFRLIHGEGDQLSGLIVDIYGSVAVVQCHSIGMYLQLDMIAAALVAVAGDVVKAVFQKSKESLPKQLADTMENGFVIGTEGPDEVLENGQKFRIDWVGGQKTGFFLDQRDNRQYLQDLAAGRSVLNTFCYTGGFSSYALSGGATHVTSVDVSAKAMVLTDENIALNHPKTKKHTSICADVLQFFKTHEEQYDIVIVDPPAFAKTLDKRHNAVQGYKRLNMAALKMLKPGGLLFTFSCSQVIDRELFQNTIVAALMEAGRDAQIVRHLSQGVDHPVHAFHPEGQYLKGLLLRVG